MRAGAGRGNAVHRADTQALRAAAPTAGPSNRLPPRARSNMDPAGRALLDAANAATRALQTA
eukprot:2913827-Alexandrium_andersonii.AAC.1